MVYDITEMAKLDAMAAEVLNQIGSKRSVIYLYGDLGSGKTTFVQCFLKKMGYTGHVQSPSYAIVNTYDVLNKSIVHADLYRLSQEDDLDYLGWDILMDKADVVLVEWPQILTETADIQIVFSENYGTRSAKVSY